MLIEKLFISQKLEIPHIYVSSNMDKLTVVYLYRRILSKGKDQSITRKNNGDGSPKCLVG